jgi:small nuclear ribonucleoprotein (snRNP)-like protein
MFLNEKCKDAFNINEFVDNIKMQLTDLENFGVMGYVEGVSRILMKNLKDLDTYSRPIHCSDLKREVFYIKDNNQWTRETDDKPVLKNAIKQVANKNIKQIQVWKNENPDCINSESRKNDQYINIVMNSMSGGTSEEQQNNISQIVKNVSKVVAIDKTTEKL